MAENFAYHEEIAASWPPKALRAPPTTPGNEALNENTNGPVRQYIPKGKRQLMI